jgi:hypothetical protein
MINLENWGLIQRVVYIPDGSFHWKSVFLSGKSRCPNLIPFLRELADIEIG